MTVGGAGHHHTLVGTWNYVNDSNGKGSIGNIAKSCTHNCTSPGISGKIVYGANDDFNLTIPLRSPFGSYTLEVLTS